MSHPDPKHPAASERDEWKARAGQYRAMCVSAQDERDAAETALAEAERTIDALRQARREDFARIRRELPHELHVLREAAVALLAAKPEVLEHVERLQAALGDTGNTPPEEKRPYPKRGEHWQHHSTGVYELVSVQRDGVYAVEPGEGETHFLRMDYFRENFTPVSPTSEKR